MQSKRSRRVVRGTLATLASTLAMGLITASGAADEKKAKGTQAPTCAPSCAAGFECVDGGCQGANHPKDKAFQGKLHMDTKCAYGALDCNVCVDDVRARFNQIRDGFDTDAKAYSFKWHDPCMKNPSSACFARIRVVPGTSNPSCALPTPRRTGAGWP